LFLLLYLFSQFYWNKKLGYNELPELQNRNHPTLRGVLKWKYAPELTPRKTENSEAIIFMILYIHISWLESDCCINLFQKV
jgi:hypothetical protein